MKMTGISGLQQIDKARIIHGKDRKGMVMKMKAKKGMISIVTGAIILSVLLAACAGSTQGKGAASPEPAQEIVGEGEKPADDVQETAEKEQGSVDAVRETAGEGQGSADAMRETAGEG